MAATWLVGLFRFLLLTSPSLLGNDTQGPAPGSQASSAPTQEVQHDILVVRHGMAQAAQARTAAAPVVLDTSPDELVLADLADLGLIHIRPLAQNGPSWKYKPKQYFGYHAKPDWTYQRAAGWRYSAQSGWRLRPEPAWSLRPGGVNALLEQLPTHGRNWRVTRWQ